MFLDDLLRRADRINQDKLAESQLLMKLGLARILRLYGDLRHNGKIWDFYVFIIENSLEVQNLTEEVVCIFLESITGLLKIDF